MKKRIFWGALLSGLLGVFLLVSASDARVIKGTTTATVQKLKVSAVSSKGAAVTVPVTNVRQKVTPAGVRFIGNFSMNVVKGQKVMLVFSRVGASGTMKAQTVAKFAKDAAGTAKTSQFNVTAPVAGGPTDIAVGNVTVGPKTATPTVNPLTNVDSDGDGLSDLDDNDDDDDGIIDSHDTDSDGNNVADVKEDMDTDNDGLVNVVDNDDDNDGIVDGKDLDSNGDGKNDWDGNTDSDNDGVLDSADKDDDNDGVLDIADNDQNGNGIPDGQEIDTDGDGIPDAIDTDDDNDGIPDSADADNDNDGTPDIEETDANGDGIPDEVEPSPKAHPKGKVNNLRLFRTVSRW